MASPMRASPSPQDALAPARPCRSSPGSLPVRLSRKVAARCGNSSLTPHHHEYSTKQAEFCALPFGAISALFRPHFSTFRGSVVRWDGLYQLANQVSQRELKRLYKPGCMRIARPPQFDISKLATDRWASLPPTSLTLRAAPSIRQARLAQIELAAHCAAGGTLKLCSAHSAWRSPDD